MNPAKQATSALISTYHKENLAPIIKKLHQLGIQLYATGGTEQFIQSLGIPVISVEEITSYPSILGGRVKTLHPKIFGGILNRRNNPADVAEVAQYNILPIDIVVVDLYPFEETVAMGYSEEEIVEKIDIGGISLIRAAAKNYNDVLCVASSEDYEEFLQLLGNGKGSTTLAERKRFAAKAFAITSHYDTAICKYLTHDAERTVLKISEPRKRELRYGENPHQKGYFFGELEAVFQQLCGKELSYNNLLDVDAAISLMGEFVAEPPAFAIIKHTNACGLAVRNTLSQAYADALAGDPVSAFGGILIANTCVDEVTAAAMDVLFFEIVIAPDYSEKALEILQRKKNRVLLRQKKQITPATTLRSCLNGFLLQDADWKTDTKASAKVVTHSQPTAREWEDLLFAAKICKHTKSNAIVLAKNKQLCASGTGQTSRVDALKQAVEKANAFTFNLNGAVMASDAFFPFPDCAAIANCAGIRAIIQPGGSLKDALSIDYCNEHNLAMVFTGTRHFKH